MKICDAKPLDGLRILNTRPAGQNQQLSEAISQAGGQSIELPTLAITPCTDWVNKLPDLSGLDIAIFASSNGVHLFFSTLRRHHLSWPTTLKTLAIGSKSAQSLSEYGVQVEAIPDIADSEHFLTLPMLQNISRKKILLIKGENGRTLIAETLKKRQTRLYPLDVYRSVMPHHPQSLLNYLWHENGFDIILLLSEQSLKNLFALFEPQAKTWLTSKPCLVISERLAEIAKTWGIKTIIPSRHDNILKDLIHYATKQRLV